MKKYLALSLGILLVGCQTFYSTIITVTDVRKSVMNELGTMYRAGQISDETDKRIGAADAQFIVAARSLELSLVAYKNGTSTNDPSAKLDSVKAPVRELISILTPLAGKLVTDKYNNNLNKATKL
jgi:hypothetical protein